MAKQTMKKRKKEIENKYTQQILTFDEQIERMRMLDDYIESILQEHKVFYQICNHIYDEFLNQYTNLDCKFYALGIVADCIGSYFYDQIEKKYITKEEEILKNVLGEEEYEEIKRKEKEERKKILIN